MATYRLWPSTDGPPTPSVDSTNYALGVEFEVSEACNFSAWHWWCQQAGTVTFGLYRVDSETTGTLLASLPDVGVTAGGWRRSAAASPVALEVGTRYRAVVFSTTDNFYCATGAYWSTGDGAAGISAGPLTSPNVSGTTGSDQCSFAADASALTFPTNSFNAANYWIDVEVSTESETNASTLEATAPLATSSVTGTATNAGALGAAAPVATASLAGSSQLAGALDAHAPLATATLLGGSTNPGTIEASSPLVTSDIASAAVNAGTLDGYAPLATASIAGTATNSGELTGIAPLVRASIAPEATLSPDRTIIVAPESRTRAVTPENRILAVTAETRTLEA